MLIRLNKKVNNRLRSDDYYEQYSRYSQYRDQMIDKIVYYENLLSSANLAYAIVWFMVSVTAIILLANPVETIDGAIRVGIIFAVVFFVRSALKKKVKRLKMTLRMETDRISRL